MPKRFKTNVLVIGGGLAGASAAHELAKNGVDVIIVDSRKTIGIPAQCAEFIPKQLMQKSLLTIGRTTIESIRIQKALW